MKKSIRITTALIALLSLMCLFVSCSEKQSQKEEKTAHQDITMEKEIFQIYREYDNVGFDVDAYISAAKEKGTYLVDKARSIGITSTDGVMCEFLIKPDNKFFLSGAKYDSVENAKKAYTYLIENESFACTVPDGSIVRVDNVVLMVSGENTVFFKDELEKITKVSADDGMHELLFDESCAVRMKNDNTADEIVDILKEKGFDCVYDQNDNVICYLLLNEKSQAINIYVVEDLSSPSEWLSYWMESHTNAKFVYSYKNSTLIAVVGVTVDPEPLLK